MKRFTFLFCSVVLVCALMVVPAFATGELQFSIDYLNHQSAVELSAPLDGLYTVNFYDADNQLVFSLPAKDFTYPNTVYYGEGSESEGPWWEMSFSYNGDALMLETGFGGCTDEDCGNFNFFYPDVSTFELVPFTPIDPEPVSPIAGIFGVFSGIGFWLASQLGVFTAIFWNGQSLTFLGILSICALAIAVVLLISYMLSRFIRFKG